MEEKLQKIASDIENDLNKNDIGFSWFIHLRLEYFDFAYIVSCTIGEYQATRMSPSYDGFSLKHNEYRRIILGIQLAIDGIMYDIRHYISEQAINKAIEKYVNDK